MAQNAQVLEWSNKWQFSYAFWGPREPQMDEKKRCVLLDGNTGSHSLLNNYTACTRTFIQSELNGAASSNCRELVDARFGEEHGYICMDTHAYNAQPPPTAAPDIGGSCPAGWDLQLGGFCYRINITRGMYFTDAFAQCSALGAGSDLASIGNEPEQEYVLAVAKRQYDELTSIGGQPHEPNGLWLGFAYRNGKLAAHDGSPIKFTDWFPNQPNPDAEPESTYCVSMEAISGRWSLEHCRGAFKYGNCVQAAETYAPQDTSCLAHNSVTPDLFFTLAVLTTTKRTSSTSRETIPAGRTTRTRTSTSRWQYSTQRVRMLAHSLCNIFNTVMSP